jgi:stage V sporulation protein S
MCFGCPKLSSGRSGLARLRRPYQLFRGFFHVDRFFSKLDLRDIKIDPFKTSYPPDAEDEVEDDTEYVVETEVVEHSYAAVTTNVRQPHTPSWAAVETPPNGNYEPLEDEGPLYGNGAYPEGNVADTQRIVVGDQRNGDVLKVSARSRPSAVAGAIAGVVRENGRAEVQAIGAGATNQAVKAVAIARDYLRETGIDAICLPAFIDVTIENEDRTAIRLVVEPR